ncbi:transglycosylase SLT domain protein [Lysobacter antibioticus]|uniref:Transglycosylase SLT domain protein n=1 Tax=Lysobacter antibioticus TaxID=84531 RepID=A0A0S2FAJ3_LYSAN|nr:transglycosylase SLT domain protein [Lysobacter antibioticus]
MLPGIELMNCPGLAVPHEVMHHVVRVESSFNPYAIGVVGGRLVRQPKNLPEAIATVRMLERRGYNFSLGVAQVNRYNLGKYGLDSYEKAFEACPNLQAGSRILAECYSRSNNDWGKSFSCYYSGNFVTGFRHGYVQKIYASINRAASNESDGQAIAVIGKSPRAEPAGAAVAAAAAAKPVYAPGRQSGPQRLAAALATSQPAPAPPPMAAPMPQLPLSATPIPVSSPSAVQPVSMGMAALVPQASQPVRVMPMNAAAAAAAPSKEPSPGDQAFVF